MDAERERDPFWDPPEDLFLGSAYVYLQPLAHGLSVEETMLPVSNYRGVTVGHLQVRIKLSDAQGQPRHDVEEDIQQPEDWLDKRLDIMVHIDSASQVEWLDSDASRGVFVQYRFYTDSKMRQTRAVHHAPVPQLGYSKQFTIRSVSSNFVNYLTTNALVLELWGKQGRGGEVVEGGGASRSVVSAGTVEMSRRGTKQGGKAGGGGGGDGGDGLAAGGGETKSDGGATMGALSKTLHTAATSSLVAAQGENTLLKESAWIDERRRLLERISGLEQEVQFLSFEKGALEKVRWEGRGEERPECAGSSR